jgi:hypothetical protein
MDPSFSQLSRVVHEERLQAAAKERHFRNVGIPEDEPRIITRRSIKWVVILVMLALWGYAL